MIPETEIAAERLAGIAGYSWQTMDANDVSAFRKIADYVLNLERELVRLREGRVSVKDRLPEVDRGNRYFGIYAFDGQPFVPVIFFVKSEPSAIAGRFFCAFGRRKETWFSIQGARFEADEVSHWMPLPAPPVMEKQGGTIVGVPKVGNE